MVGPPWMMFGGGVGPADGTGPAALRLRVPGWPEQLYGLRSALRRWLDCTGANEDEVIAMQIAAGEAASNAVEHAYRGGDPGPISLAAEMEVGNVIRVAIADQGRWRPPRTVDGGRGRGLVLMRECVDHLSLERSPQGTTVVLRLRLRGKGPAGKGPWAGPSPVRPAEY